MTHLPSGAARRVLVAFVVATAFPMAASAALPDACSLISMAEVNRMAKGGDAVHVEKRGGINLAECVFLDSGKSAVLTVQLREESDPKKALTDDIAMFERMYRKPSKTVTGVGDQAAWIDINLTLHFRQGQRVVMVYFTGSKYGGEPITTDVAKLISSRLR